MLNNVPVLSVWGSAPSLPLCAPHTMVCKCDPASSASLALVQSALELTPGIRLSTCFHVRKLLCLDAIPQGAVIAHFTAPFRSLHEYHLLDESCMEDRSLPCCFALALLIPDETSG